MARRHWKPPPRSIQAALVDRPLPPRPAFSVTSDVPSPLLSCGLLVPYGNIEVHSRRCRNLPPQHPCRSPRSPPLQTGFFCHIFEGTVRLLMIDAIPILRSRLFRNGPFGRQILERRAATMVDIGPVPFPKKTRRKISPQKSPRPLHAISKRNAAPPHLDACSGNLAPNRVMAERQSPGIKAPGQCISEQINRVYNGRGFPFWNGHSTMSQSTN